MRETFARALAAALMAGSIATVVGMAALVRTPNEAARPISAPPSALQRSVRLAAQPAPRQHRSVARLVPTRTIQVPAPPAPARPSPAVVRRPPAPPRVRRGGPRPATRVTTPAASPASVSEPAPRPDEPAAAPTAVPSAET